MERLKKIKKFISAAIAAATLLTVTAFPASAADYDPYDVDRNGSINIGDLVYISKYLLGAYSISNYNQLDVNRSLTVDAADQDCLTTYLLGGGKNNGAYYSRKTGNVVSAPTVSGFTPSNSSSSSAGRTYMRCRYDNNGNPTALSNYTLTPTPMTLNGGASSRAVIGEDERYTEDGPETNGIVYLEDIGTGFIVGDHQIATAAHCVYDIYQKKWYSMAIKTYDLNGCITNNTLHPVEAHFPKSYTSIGDYKYDYALITVSEDLSDYVHFSLGTPYNVSASDYSNIPIYVTGFPGAKEEQSGIRLFSAEGNVLDKNSKLASYNDIVCYDVDTSSGESGAPVYTITKIGNEYVYTAIAIHRGGREEYGRNYGSMVTNYHLQFYKNNPNASYSAN